MITEGKRTLLAFCNGAGYEYNDKEVDQILKSEALLDKQMKSESTNMAKYPSFCWSMVKLVVAWNACCMVFFGILMGDLPGGVLLNNAYIGIMSIMGGPLMCFLMSSRFAYRRRILVVQYSMIGLLCCLMAVLTMYNKR